MQSKEGLTARDPSLYLPSYLLRVCHARYDACITKAQSWFQSTEIEAYHLDGSPKCDSPVLDAKQLLQKSKTAYDILQDKVQMRKAIEDTSVRWNAGRRT